MHRARQYRAEPMTQFQQHRSVVRRIVAIGTQTELDRCRYSGTGTLQRGLCLQLIRFSFSLPARNTAARSSTMLRVVLALLLGSLAYKSVAAPGDLYVQVALSVNGSATGCSILKMAPDSELSEWVATTAITAVTGESTCDFDDTTMVIDDDGVIYAAEDTSHDILKVSPTGVVEVFVPAADIDAVIGETTDIDNGMALSPRDGHLYIADEDCNCVLKVTVPDGDVSIVVTEATIRSATGATGESDLEGGIAVDGAGNIYLTEDRTDSIVKVTSNGDASVLVREADITAVTGAGYADLDVAIALRGYLYVADDAGNNDSLLQVNAVSGEVDQLASAATLAAAANLESADLEGGMAIDRFGSIHLGDDGDTADKENVANIIRVNQGGGPAYLVLSDAEISAFYSDLYSATARLRGGMAFQPSTPNSVPVPSGFAWSIFAMILALLALARSRLPRWLNKS